MALLQKTNFMGIDLENSYINIWNINVNPSKIEKVLQKEIIESSEMIWEDWAMKPNYVLIQEKIVWLVKVFIVDIIFNRFTNSWKEFLIRKENLQFTIENESDLNFKHFYELAKERFENSIDC